MQDAPSNKRRKINNPSLTLRQAIGEILYVDKGTYDYIKKIISSRTSISCAEPYFKNTLNEMGEFYEPHNSYYLRQSHYTSVDWQNSSILTCVVFVFF